MPIFDKRPEANDTWRLLDSSGSNIGRIWAGSHVDRILRDVTLAEAVRDAIAAGGSATTRRAAVRTAMQTWSTAGGHSVDLANVMLSLENPPGSGNVDGNRHLFLGGQHVGYLGIPDVDDDRHGKLMRSVRLAEELFSGEQLGTSSARNSALDAALTRFSSGGGVG